MSTLLVQLRANLARHILLHRQDGSRDEIEANLAEQMALRVQAAVLPEWQAWAGPGEFDQGPDARRGAIKMELTNLTDDELMAIAESG